MRPRIYVLCVVQHWLCATGAAPLVGPQGALSACVNLSEGSATNCKGIQAVRLSPWLTPNGGRCAAAVRACVHAGQHLRDMLQAGMHADGTAEAADEALRLLLDAGYSDDSAGMGAMLGAAGHVAFVCSNGHNAAATASSSCTPAPWRGLVSTAIKLARRATHRLCRSLRAAAPVAPASSRQQRHLHEPPGGGATREARGAAAEDKQSNMLIAELLGLATGAASILGMSSGASFIQAPQFALASVAVSPAGLHY